VARRDPGVARIHGSARWQAVRAQVLREAPICRECARLGLTEPATQVDHVLGLVLRPDLVHGAGPPRRAGDGIRAQSHALCKYS
jgi:myo-inositol catabolism protein IolC